MMLFSSLGGVLPRANNDGTTFGTMRMSGERKAFSSSSSSFSFKRGGGKGVARCCARFGRFRATTRCSNYGGGLFFNRVGSLSLKSKNHALSFSTSLSFYSTTTTSSSSSNTATAAFGSFPNRRRLSFISKAQDDDEEYFEEEDEEEEEREGDVEDDDDQDQDQDQEDEEYEEEDDDDEEGIDEENDDDDEDDDGDENVRLLRDTFELANIDVVKWIDLEEEEDVEISGIVSDARYAIPGDLFVCVDNSSDDQDPHDGHDDVSDAIALRGAVAVVSEREDGVAENANGAPVAVVKSTKGILGKLGKAFYEDPSGKLVIAGVLGHRGKDTTCNLIKSIFEASERTLKKNGADDQSEDEDDEDEYGDEDEYSNRAGVVTSSGYYVTPEISEEDLDEIPHSCAECGATCIPKDVRTEMGSSDFISCPSCGAEEIHLDPIVPEMKITQHGGVWIPEEQDLTEGRACSAPGWLAPYQGKYEIPESAPDALQNQQILAGMVDAGASAVAVEISDESLLKGHIDSVNVDIIVFTNSPRMTAANNGSEDNDDEDQETSTSASSGDDEEKADTEEKLIKEGEGEKEEDAFETSYESNLTEEEVQSWRERSLAFISSLDDPKHQRVVVNLDDDFASEIISNCKVPVVTYARRREHRDIADVYCERVDLSLFETAVLVSTPVGETEIVTALVGDANVSNVLASIASGLATEIPLENIAQGLGRANPAGGRMELVDEGQKFCALVDSAKTPEDVMNAIQSARAIPQCRRVIVVVGADGTNNDINATIDNGTEKAMRRKLGETVDKYADVVFVTTQSPKNEDAYYLLEDVVDGFRSRVYDLPEVKERLPDGIITDIPFMKDMYLIHPNAQSEAVELQNLVRRYVIVDRFFAVRAAIAMAEENDCVLILGKGDQDFFEIEGQKYWFDDRMESRDALKRLPALQAEGVVMTSLPWFRVEDGAFQGNILGITAT